MSTEERIRNTVEEFGLPCGNGTYRGEESLYATFNVDRIPADYADDEPGCVRALIQVHLFAPFTCNTLELRRKMRKGLASAGFSYPSEVNASENARSFSGTEQHIVFECERLEEV